MLKLLPHTLLLSQYIVFQTYKNTTYCYLI
nr:MAG TPA: hypothetical protein [Bacteriophage sp.]DAN38205.1 MAG TPA: hypothetical protein [Caudoviricetes sp.]